MTFIKYHFFYSSNQNHHFNQKFFCKLILILNTQQNTTQFHQTTRYLRLEIEWMKRKLLQMILNYLKCINCMHKLKFGNLRFYLVLMDIKLLTALIKDFGVLYKLKFESGVHRVQKVPQNESNSWANFSTDLAGRIAQSSCNVVIQNEKQKYKNRQKLLKILCQIMDMNFKRTNQREKQMAKVIDQIRVNQNMKLSINQNNFQPNQSYLLQN
ncbi:unnamed protein product [Paramecium sonneborni]|uniref:Peptide chain release factor domain-containing protein n=1 Tax=Paramecium sonneborni TaxID=65129 RepID=A0A8S1MPA5_9CILI|nr:unnamed protein product [Paramecium sonneborni]